MESNNSIYTFNASLDRIEIDARNHPFAREATLRLHKQHQPPAKSLPLESTAGIFPLISHLMEIHVDGRLLGRWDLDLLALQAAHPVRDLTRKFYSFAKDKMVQLTLPLPLAEEGSSKVSSSSTAKLYSDEHLKIIRFHLKTHEAFHTTVSYLSKMAGLLPVEAPERSSQQRPYPRAPSAIDSSRISPSGFQNTMRLPIRPPSRLFAPRPVFEQENPPVKSLYRLSGPRRRESIAGWDTTTPWARSTHDSQPLRPASARAYWDNYGHAYSLGHQEARLNATENRFYPPPPSSQRFSDNHIQEKILVGNSFHIDSPEYSPPYHDIDGPRDAAIRRARRFRSATIRASSTDHFDSDWEPTTVNQFDGSINASPPRNRPSLAESEMPAPPCDPFKHPKLPQDTDDMARKTSVTQISASELDASPSLSRPPSRHGVSSETLAGQVWAPAPEPQDLGKNMSHVPMCETAEKKRPASRQARPLSTAKKQRKMNQKSQLQKLQNFQHQGVLGQVQLAPYALGATLSASPDTTDSGTAATSPKLATSACTRCRQRKVRCDRQFPACGTCAKAGVSPCLYPIISQQPDTDRPEDHATQSPDHISLDDSGDQIGASAVTGYLERARSQVKSQETERQALEQAAVATVPKIPLSDVGTQTDKLVEQRLRMNLSQLTKLVISGVELQKCQHEKVIQSIQSIEGASRNHREKLLGAARIGLEFGEGLLGLYRDATKESAW